MSTVTRNEELLYTFTIHGQPFDCLKSDRSMFFAHPSLLMVDVDRAKLESLKVSTIWQRMCARVQENGESWIVYETHNGYHLFLASRLVPAASEESQGILAHLGCDPVYADLCKDQGMYSYRAIRNAPNAQPPRYQQSFGKAGKFRSLIVELNKEIQESW